ncbi:MAG: AIR synthase-related protein, partial [archaeon]|nr:AIR synthase-related protein [archaeon]
FFKATESNLIASAISITSGGLGIALAKMCIAGNFGCTADLSKLDTENIDRDDLILFSESQSRIIATIDPKKKDLFEDMMAGCNLSLIGQVTDETFLKIRGIKGNEIISCQINDLAKSYRKTFERF